GASAILLSVPLPAEWLGSWHDIVDLYLSTCVVLYLVLVPTMWGVGALWRCLTSRLSAPEAAAAAEETSNHTATPRVAQPRRARWERRWPLVLLAACLVELLTHAGDRNGWVASSQP